MTGLIEDYQYELKKISDFAERTVENYVNCIVMFSEWIGLKYNISPVKAEGDHLCEWIEKVKGKGLSFSRLEHHRSALRTFYAMLYKMKIIKRNIADAIPALIKRRVSKVMPVSEETVERLLEAVDQSTWTGKRNYMIISMLWALGLRISELTGLKVGSFEPYHDPLNKTGLLRVRGKNKKQRALFIVDKLYDNLMEYLSHEESPGKERDPLFPVEGGKAISNNRVQKKLKEYCKAAGIKERITPHVLRHSFATEMYHAGVPLHAIQAMMGHDTKTETSVYIKVSNAFKEEALTLLTLSGRALWQQ
jgi:integrase/recombinase XerD